MRLSLAKLLGLLSLSFILVLAACNGDTEDAVEPETDDTTPTAAAEMTPEDDDEATPAMDDATPQATPDDGTPTADGTPMATTQEGTPVAVDELIDLRLAYSYLVEQESFGMNINIEGIPGEVDNLQGAEEGAVIVVRQNGEDRWVEILSGDGSQVLAEVWRVDDEYYADMGEGPMQVPQDDPMAQQVMMYADIHGRLLTALDAPEETHYEFVRSEELNGERGNVNTNVHEASYEAGQGLLEEVPFFIGVETVMVDSTMWVHAEDGYLLRAEMQVQPANGGMNGESTITVNVQEVGEVDAIEAPVDNGS